MRCHTSKSVGAHAVRGVEEEAYLIHSINNRIAVVATCYIPHALPFAGQLGYTSVPDLWFACGHAMRLHIPDCTPLVQVGITSVGGG